MLGRKGDVDGEHAVRGVCRELSEVLGCSTAASACSRGHHSCRAVAAEAAGSPIFLGILKVPKSVPGCACFLGLIAPGKVKHQSLCCVCLKHYLCFLNKNSEKP